MNDLYKYEKELIEKGFKLIVGTDEAGRGPWAGPLVAAACILPLNYESKIINDSKTLKESEREIAFKEIIENAIDYSVVFMTSKDVDELNPKAASRRAMEKAINNLNPKADYALVDFETLELKIPQNGITKGDSKSISIAAASILAKVSRDNYMKELGKKYPKYGFENHKGYGTKKHITAIELYGVIDEHRLSYKPLNKYRVASHD